MNFDYEKVKEKFGKEYADELKEKYSFKELDEEPNIDEVWTKVSCDKCGQFKRIVRQHHFDGKLCCEDCWEEIKNEF